MLHHYRFRAPGIWIRGLVCFFVSTIINAAVLAVSEEADSVSANRPQLNASVSTVGTLRDDTGSNKGRIRLRPQSLSGYASHTSRASGIHYASGNPKVRGTIQPIGGTAGISDCNGPITATHTDSNFTSGSFVIQAGFAEGEIAAASYVLDPSEFPITIESLEAIFAAPRVSSPTLTRYSVIIWDGTPDLGDVVALFQSDDEFIPHLRMEPSNNPVGVNVKIVIDPGDPDQVVVTNANETNTFSIGYRIDEHNAQEFDPCLIGPAVDMNAFPTTDLALSTTTDNWIQAINCGPLGCASGWRRFSQLGACRPRGDWVMRAVYRCEPPIQIGACCFPDAACDEFILREDCEFEEGLFMGSDTRCGQIQCPEPLGACCLNGTCLPDVERATCTAVNGTFIGPNTFCSTQTCLSRACCMPDGSCEDIIQHTCVEHGGAFHGNSVCAMYNCPQPTGACCIGTVCIPGQTEATCQNVGSWNGANSVCGPVSCVPNACPEGMITLSSPPSGVVDARQPHPTNSASLGAMQGIGSIDEPVVLTIGVTSAQIECFSLCETDFDGAFGPNEIAGVVESPPGVYSIVLERPITSGAVTVVGYRDASFVTYTSHPGNVNADQTVNATDTFNLVQYLNGVFDSPFGSFSFDLDHSGQVNGLDLVRSVDLFNGADLYYPWSNTPKPLGTGCP